jgi:integrase
MGVFQRKNKEGAEGKSWYVDYYNPHGKRIIKRIGPRKKEAEDYLGKVKAAIREGRFFDIKKENKTTFDDLLNEYIKKMEGTKYFETSIKYFTGNNVKGDQEVKGILREHFAGKMLSEIDYKALEDFRDSRKETPTQYGSPRSERTVNLEMAILRHMFRKGAKWGMIEKNPFENAEDLFYKVRNKRERALTGDEVKKLVEACPPYLKGIVITGIYTGLRKGDILNLKWQDIDLEKGIIRLIEAKTKKTRVIVLNEDMKKLLQILPVKGEYLFPNKDGKPFRDIKRSFETALRDAGIKQDKDRRSKIVFHTLRHTCISLLQEKGADTTAVKNYVEHASEEMTRRYTHLTEEYARRTASILDGMCGVESLDRNKMETIGKKSKTSQNASLASA